jgi:hypothetical protein
MESFVKGTPVVPPAECDRRATVLKTACSALGAAVAVVFLFAGNSVLAASKAKDRPSAPLRSPSGVSTSAHGNAAEDRLRNIMKICRCDEYDRAKGAY